MQGQSSSGAAGMGGWGGNLLTMQNADVSAAEMVAVDPPGTVQQDDGGTTLESMILFKRRSTTVSSWGVLPETFIDTTATSSRPSTLSQVTCFGSNLCALEDWKIGKRGFAIANCCRLLQEYSTDLKKLNEKGSRMSHTGARSSPLSISGDFAAWSDK